MFAISCRSASSSNYFPQVESRFESEDSRTHHYLSRNTAPALRQILQDYLLTPHLTTVISMESSGLDAMIDLNKTNDMARLYRLFITVPTGLPCLKRAFKDSIRRRGDTINQASSGVEGSQTAASKTAQGVQILALALKWVQDVLDLKDLFDKIWKEALSCDRELESTLNEVQYFPSSILFLNMAKIVYRRSRTSSTSMRNRPSSSHCSSMSTSGRVSKE